ncbi:MAG: deoxyhypusine synthase [Candidatus Bathyarchaeia archaeon]
MQNVKQMKVYAGMSVNKLIEEMNECGVLGAGKIAKAVEITTKMFNDPDCTVLLSLAGPLVAGGLRKIIKDLIEYGYLKAIITTGANIVHDVVESLGYKHIRGTFKSNDSRLWKEGIGRIGDIYIELKVFEKVEKWIYKNLESLPEKERERLSPNKLLFELGKRIDDNDSILASAAKENVPIICPWLIDSIIGFQIWSFGRIKTLKIDPMLDLNLLMDLVLNAKKVGAMILGGGMPKHFTLFANTFRGGVDFTVQITMDRPEAGSLSGAPLEEAISWGKVKDEANLVTVICDVTIAFPIIIAATLERLKKAF